jgi:type VI secretion system secreted protein VgrG
MDVEESMRNDQLRFTTAAISDATIVAVAGREAISRPYELTIELASSSSSLPLDEIVGARASLDLGGRTVHGVIARFEQGDELGDGRYGYVAELVPWLALLGVGRQSRVFQGLTVPEIVMAVCAAYADAGAVELRLERAYRRRDYVVQYAESDLAFAARLLEEEGISYFFAQGEERERLVLTDHNGGFAAGPELHYRHDLLSLRCIAQAVPERLVLTDQREDQPGLPLQAEAPIHARGVGLWAEDGARFETPEEGERLAAIRAEEHRGRRTRVFGEAARCVAAGALAALGGHFRADFNRALLVTSATYEWRGGALHSSFEATFADSPFRPARVTPRPRIHGLKHARLEEHGDGDHAASDERGRYRVRLPFDVSGGEASTPMRLAQPYGAGDSGIHFPLPRGAEVVWSCIDGDPDRPVIAGAVAADRGVGAPVIEMGRARRAPAPPLAPSAALHEQPHHGAVTEEVAYTTSSDGSGKSDTWLRFAIPHSLDDGTTGTTYLRLGERPDDQLLERNLAAWEEDGQYVLSLNVKGGEKERWDQASLWGVFDYTAGTRTVVTRRNKEEVVGGSYRVAVLGGTVGTFDATPYQMWFFEDSWTAAKWRKIEVATGSESRWFLGDRENYSLGYQYDATVGLNATASLVGQIDVTAGVKVSAEVMLSASYVAGRRFEYTCESSLSYAKNQDLKASGAIRLRVKPSDAVERKATKKKVAVITGVVAGAVGAVSTAVTTGLKDGSGEDTNKGLVTTGALAQAATIGMGGGLLLHSIVRTFGGSTGGADPELILEKGEILLRCGGASLSLRKQGILLQCGQSVLFLGKEGAVILSAGGGEVQLLGTKGTNVQGDLKLAKKLVGDISDLAMPPAAVTAAIAAATAKLKRAQSELELRRVQRQKREIDEVMDLAP